MTWELHRGPEADAGDDLIASGEAQVNRLLCPSCGDWQVNLIKGDELLLLRLEVSGINAPDEESS